MTKRSIPKTHRLPKRRDLGEWGPPGPEPWHPPGRQGVKRTNPDTGPLRCENCGETWCRCGANKS